MLWTIICKAQLRPNYNYNTRDVYRECINIYNTDLKTQNCECVITKQESRMCECMNNMIKQNVMKMLIMNDYELMNDN